MTHFPSRCTGRTFDSQMPEGGDGEIDHCPISARVRPVHYVCISDKQNNVCLGKNVNIYHCIHITLSHSDMI